MNIDKKKSFIYFLIINIVMTTVCLNALVVMADNDDSYDVDEDSYSYVYTQPDVYTEPDEYSYAEVSDYYTPDDTYTESSEDTYTTQDDNSEYVYSESSDEWQYTQNSFETYEYSVANDPPYYVPSENTEYDESSYEVWSESSYGEASVQDGSDQEITGYEFSDSETLTSEDWERLKNSAQSSDFRINIASVPGGGDDAIAMIKEGKSSGNDDWVYLVWGIVLIGVGAVAAAVVVITSIYSKKKLQTKAGTNRKAPVEDIFSDRNRTNRKNPGSENSKVVSKQDTSEIVIKDIDKKKDDYEDFFDKT